MWTRPRAWSSGPVRTPKPPAWSDLVADGAASELPGYDGFQNIGQHAGRQTRGVGIDDHFAQERIRSAGREVNVLNLFAYTGAASAACAAAGAKVCHVDAAKGMVQGARENAKASGRFQPPWVRGVFQMAWGSGRTRSLSPSCGRSDFSRFALLCVKRGSFTMPAYDTLLFRKSQGGNGEKFCPFSAPPPRCQRKAGNFL